MTHQDTRAGCHRRLSVVLALASALTLPTFAGAQVVRSASGIGVASATAARVPT
jgi:hypothetical protein